MENPNLLSPSVLAFVGDGVYGLCVRTKLAETNRPSGELHKLSVEYVDSKKWYEHIGIGFEDEAEITVYLPEKEYDALSKVCQVAQRKKLFYPTLVYQR